MEARLRRGRRRFPHVSEVASPYSSGGAAAISKDGKIAYATIQFDVQNNKLDKEKTERKSSPPPRAAGGQRPEVQLGGQPIQEADQKKAATPPSGSACWRRSSSCCSPSARSSRWACRSSPRCSRSASGISLVDARHPRLRHRELRAGVGGDDRPRRRDRLRALHPHPLPQRPRRRARAAAGGDPRPSTRPGAPSSSPGSR